MARREPTDGPEFPLLYDAQEFGLQLHGQLPDFVKEGGAAVREVEQPRFAHNGTGECAFGVPEQFALDQAARQCRAVHRHERRTILAVNSAGDDLFPRASLAEDEYWPARPLQSLDLAQDFLHAGRITDGLRARHRMHFQHHLACIVAKPTG